MSQSTDDFSNDEDDAMAKALRDESANDYEIGHETYDLEMVVGDGFAMPIMRLKR